MVVEVLAFEVLNLLEHVVCSAVEMELKIQFFIGKIIN